MLSQRRDNVMDKDKKSPDIPSVSREGNFQITLRRIYFDAFHEMLVALKLDPFDFNFLAFV